MADGTTISWTDATWNPVTGCAVVSPGCTNCYAMRLAGTRLRHHPSRAGLTRDSKAGPVWTGELRLNEGWLDQPLRWARPRMVFVCAHGDLFANGVEDAWLDRIFAVMAMAPQHTFQVLTKRPARMRDYLRTRAGDWWMMWPDANPAGMLPISRQAQRLAMRGPAAGGPRVSFPLPNVWCGVSVEDQRRADERIPILLETPALVRWISAEPLLGPLDIRPYLFGEETHGVDLTRPVGTRVGATTDWRPPLDWVVAGGESGPGARPMHPDWIRALRDQCARDQVPFHFKQWGAWKEGSDFASDAMAVAADGRALTPTPAELHEADRAAPALGLAMMRLVGKKAAGRMLDGVTHDGFPQAEEVLF